MKLNNVLVLIADGHPDCRGEAIEITGVKLPEEPIVVMQHFEHGTNLGLAVFRKDGVSIFADIEFNATGAQFVQRMQGRCIYPAMLGKIGAVRNFPETKVREVTECTLVTIGLGFDNSDSRIPSLDFEQIKPVSASLKLPANSQSQALIEQVEKTMNTQLIADIARVTHEANRAYCATIGDNTQKPWDEAEEWQRESAIAGVLYALENPDVTPAGQHEAWARHKKADGWKYGPIKDADKKEHPCIVPYDQLPPEQQKKDALFRGVVLALKP